MGPAVGTEKEGTGSGNVSVFDVASGARLGASVTTTPGPTSVLVVPPAGAAATTSR